MKYYTINEKAAKEAKSLWSFSDYEEESKTREYQSQVDEVYTIVSELPEELQEKGEALADAYAKSQQTGISLLKSQQTGITSNLKLNLCIRLL